MGEEELKNVESTEVAVTPTDTPAEPTPTPTHTPLPPPPAAAPPPPVEEKSVVPTTEEKADDTKALAVVDKAPDMEKKGSGSIDRDLVLGRLETEKRLSLIKAWEDSEKTKAENKAQRSLSTIEAWENTKKANIEAKLRSIEEKLEKKKAEYTEAMKNKIGLIHKEADERKAMVEAKRGEELLKAEETAAKHRATNSTPKKLFGCFGM